MNSPIKYPPPGMTRSRPVDRSCPLYVRRGHKDLCLVDLESHEVRELLMGCPEKCADRARAIGLRWDHIP